jgi:hypothetical protein
MRVEEQYTDVLQNIELGIVLTYRDRPNLSDHDVRRTLEALVDVYKAENIGRAPRQFGLSVDELLLMENVKRMCEWRLGRASLGDDPGKAGKIAPKPITVDEIILCLKKILKSVDKWTRSGGRQGYLNFIIRFVG